MAPKFDTVPVQASELSELTQTSPEGTHVTARTARGLRRACQRGMATAEYAVGILAAVALALVLLNIFNNNEFFTTLLAFVVSLIGKVGLMIG